MHEYMKWRLAPEFYVPDDDCRARPVLSAKMFGGVRLSGALKNAMVI